MSTKTGLAPQWEIVLAVAMKVKGDGFVLRFQVENGDHSFISLAGTSKIAYV